MKIAVSSTGDKMDSAVDPRFGRCMYFIIVDLDSMSSEAVSNQSAMASGGAGIQAAQTVIDLGVSVVITGHVGPNAFQTLNAGGIKIVTDAAGTVKEVIEKYKKGGLKETSSATVASHAGMGIGAGKGGMGRGGMGGGRGMGGGGGGGRR
jgi:predicted Fe-Mo cluster-binding NifX family protein